MGTSRTWLKVHPPTRQWPTGHNPGGSPGPEWSRQNTDLNPVNHLWRAETYNLTKCDTRVWKLGFRGSWSSAHRMDLLKCFYSWYEAGKTELMPSYGGLQPWNGGRSAPRIVLCTPIQSWEQAWLMLIGSLNQEMCLPSMSLMAPTLLEWIKNLYCLLNDNVSMSYSNSL